MEDDATLDEDGLESRMIWEVIAVGKFTIVELVKLVAFPFRWGQLCKNKEIIVAPKK